MSIQREELKNLKFGNIVSGGMLAPVHPGEILLHDFIEPMGMTSYEVAKFSNISQCHVDEICVGKCAITADTAMRLGRFFGMSAQTWMNLQAQYDIEIANMER